jgi:hypothetical protein
MRKPVLPRSLPVVIVIVTGNFGNRDNIFGHLPRSGVVDEDRWRRTGGTNDG